MNGPVPAPQRGPGAPAFGTRGTAQRGVPVRHQAHRAEGLAAGRAAPSLKPLDRRLLSHFPSGGAAHAYVTGFLEGYFSAGGGRRAGVGSDEHHLWRVHYTDLVTARYQAEEAPLGIPTEPVNLLERFRQDPEAQRIFAEHARREAARRAEREARAAEIRSVAAAAGMSVADVTAIYDAYDREQGRRQLRAAVIDPRGVPFLQTPVARTTRVVGGWLSYVMPFAGVIEAYYGVDAVSGEQLSTGQRVLRAGLDLLPIGLVATGASIGVRAGLRVGGRLTARAAIGIARLGARLGMHPRVFLPLLGRLAKLGRSAGVHVRNAYRKLIEAARSGGSARLTAEEARALRELRDSMGSGARGASRAARRRARRRLTAEQWERLAELHPALPRYLDRHAKIALDQGSVSEVAKLFRSTRRSGGTYQEVRSASGELTVLEKVHARDAVQRIQVLPPGQRAGDRTPDLRLTLTGGDQFSVEITTPTLARRAQRGPAREGAARQAPPATKTRAPRSSEIRQAFMRKIKHGQISEANPGAVVVNIQRRPPGPMLSRRQVEELEQAIADNPNIRELLIVAPTKSGRRVYRVGSRDAGLGLADEALDVTAAAAR